MLTSHRSGTSVLALFLTAAAGLTVPGCAAQGVDDSVASERSAVTTADGPTPVIFDNDMDFDDAAALAYLSQLHKQGEIELKLVTVTSAGAAYPGKGIRHARCLLERFGITDVPVADSATPGTYAFPFILRFTIDLILFQLTSDCTASNAPSEVPAPEAILDVLAASDRPVTIMITGPVTNVAAAAELAATDGRPFGTQIDHTWIQGGMFGDEDGLCCGLELVFDNTQTFNIWADPGAAQDLLASLPPTRSSLIGHDATKNAPIHPEFIARLLAEGTTPEAAYVGALGSHPILLAAIAGGLPVFWWDPMAVVGATTGGVVEYDIMWIGIVQDGAAAGRTEEVEPGEGALTHFSIDSDGEAFEARFFSVLNGSP